MVYDACVDSDVVFEDLYEECPTSHLNGLGDVEFSGGVSLGHAEQRRRPRRSR